VRQIAHADSVIALVASQCKTKPGRFRGGISTQSVSGSIAKNGQTPLVTLTVQSAKRKVATCTANGLARTVIDKLSAFANQKIKNFRSQIEVFNRDITSIDAGLKDSSLSLTDKLVLQTRLTTDQTQKLTITQLLQQATIVEKPSILTAAHASRVTARSRRNAVVVAALIGLVLGAIVALMWDGVAAGWSRRRNHHL
jgi:hypothetical protein